MSSIRMPHVLIALDGSETGLRAVRHVADMLCAARATHVTLLHVVGLEPELLEHPGGHDDTEEDALEQGVATGIRAAKAELEAAAQRDVFEAARQLIHNAQNPRHPSTIDTQFVAEPHPDPAEAVIDQAATGNYDAVVVGRRGVGGIVGLLLGSVATRVVKKVSGCAVWVVE